jgi:hypothetical protein
LLHLPLAAFATFVGLVFALQVVSLLILIDLGLRMIAGPIEDDGPVLVQIHQVRVALLHGPIPGVAAEAANGDDIARKLPIVVHELRRYGPDVLPRVPLRRVILCGKISAGGDRAGGLTLRGQGMILLDVTRRGPDALAVLAHAIHHEMSHILDDALPADAARDAKWSRLNPADFSYGREEVLQALKVLGEAPGARPYTAGFLTYYAMASPDEDRAEILAVMMSDPEEWTRIAVEDPILRAKGRLLRAALVAWNPSLAAALPSGPP